MGIRCALPELPVSRLLALGRPTHAWLCACGAVGCVRAAGEPVNCGAPAIQAPCTSENTLAVFCELTAHDGAECGQPDLRWPALYVVNPRVTESVPVRRRASAGAVQLGSLNAMENVTAVAAHGDWLRVVWEEVCAACACFAACCTSGANRAMRGRTDPHTRTSVFTRAPEASDLLPSTTCVAATPPLSLYTHHRRRTPVAVDVAAATTAICLRGGWRHTAAPAAAHQAAAASLPSPTHPFSATPPRRNPTLGHEKGNEIRPC